MTTMNTYEQKSVCPYCGYFQESASNVDHKGEHPRPPKAEDASLCIKCAEYSIFTEELTLRKPNVQEQEELAQDDNAQRIRNTLIQMLMKKQKQ